MLDFVTYSGLLSVHPEARGRLAWALQGGTWVPTDDRPEHEHLLAFDAGELVGIVKYELPTGGRTHLRHLLIREDRRKEGLAGAVLDEFLRRTSTTYPNVIVECEIQSQMPEAVRRLLTSRGFVQTGDEWTKQL